MSGHDDGGPAFPGVHYRDDEGQEFASHGGMSLRDWFAGQVQDDDRLVKCIRAMDDKALEFFARFPFAERDEWVTEVGDECYTEWSAIPSEVEKIVRRLELEAYAIARVRYMQADAMLAERAKRQGGGE